MTVDAIAVDNMCESKMDLNREKEPKFEHGDCKSKLGQKVAVYEGETTRRDNSELEGVATDPIFRNRLGKIRFKVGKRLSLFDLTKPSPERVRDQRHKCCSFNISNSGPS
jgi:hypothetical protein